LGSATLVGFSLGPDRQSLVADTYISGIVLLVGIGFTWAGFQDEQQNPGQRAKMSLFVVLLGAALGAAIGALTAVLTS
jgi:Na+/H+ antiporter NhaD/arsenite permease-like protein